MLGKSILPVQGFPQQGWTARAAARAATTPMKISEFRAKNLLFLAPTLLNKILFIFFDHSYGFRSYVPKIRPKYLLHSEIQRRGSVAEFKKI